VYVLNIAKKTEEIYESIKNGERGGVKLKKKTVLIRKEKKKNQTV
jgi:hypothetical protein